MTRSRIFPFRSSFSSHVYISKLWVTALIVFTYLFGFLLLFFDSLTDCLALIGIGALIFAINCSFMIWNIGIFRYFIVVESFFCMLWFVWPDPCFVYILFCFWIRLGIFILLFDSVLQIFFVENNFCDCLTLLIRLNTPCLLDVHSICFLLLY